MEYHGRKIEKEQRNDLRSETAKEVIWNDMAAEPASEHTTCNVGEQDTVLMIETCQLKEGRKKLTDSTGMEVRETLIR